MLHFLSIKSMFPNDPQRKVSVYDFFIKTESTKTEFCVKNEESKTKISVEQQREEKKEREKQQKKYIETLNYIKIFFLHLSSKVA